MPQATGQSAPGALDGLRVVEIADNDTALGGKFLADLGAEVIKIQGPGQKPAMEHSLRWQVCNLGKKLLSLDVESPGGGSALRDLLGTADIFLESNPPGYLDGLGMDYKTLRRDNPGLVMVSTTSFGQSGPYSGFAGDDIVLWAMGGMLYVTGSQERPPLQLSVPQAYLVAGAQTALAAMIANTHSRRTGQGQHVDLSVQACIPWVAQTAPDYWPCFEGIQQRGGTGWTIPSQVEPGGLRRNTTWRCRDGYVCAYLIAGGPAEKMNAALFKWMSEEGLDLPDLEGLSWDYFSLRQIKQELIDGIEAKMAEFFLKLDKNHLFKEGQKRGVMVYPVTDMTEILANGHLNARGYWEDISVDQGKKARVPSRWAHMSLTPLQAAGLAVSTDEDLAESAKKRTGTVPTAATSRTQPFEGLLVADFSWAVAGPLATKFLAEHGATVIRVESTDPRAMDIVRSVPPYYEDDPSLESSGLFQRLNLNKRSLGLDLGTAAGRELARRLILEADVVVENFRRGVMERWELDHATMSLDNPGLIYLSSTNLGQTGPLSSYGGFGNLLTAYAGFYALTGWPDQEPLPLPGAYTDYIAPILSALALIAALRHRDISGHGQYIDISQLECGLQMLALPLSQQDSQGHPWPRMGNRSLYACPHGVFPCLGQDRWCAISIQNDHQWHACKQALDQPPEFGPESYSSAEVRFENQDGLERALAEVTSLWPAERLMAVLQEAGVPAGMVATSEDLFKDPQLNGRDFYRQLDHPLLAKHWVMQSPALFSATPQIVRRHAPCLGQDNEMVCREILKLTQTEMEAMADMGAFGTIDNGKQGKISSSGKGGG